MNTILKDFQVRAVDSMCRGFRVASEEIRAGGSRQAIVLSSLTGSGKTLIMTATLEAIVCGDAVRTANPRAVFLWITDQPELNEQTRRKILSASSVFGPSHLVTVDAAFDQETFTPGRIYFLNTQKVGKDTHLTAHGDQRRFTIWETIANTISVSPDSFAVVLDEAHKGMSEKKADRELAQSIVQKFIKGSPGEMPPVPLVIGMSATPQRFQSLLTGVPNLVTRLVDVEVADIRASGLVKEKVVLFFPEAATGVDWSLLSAATRKWKDFCSQWNDYCVSEHEPLPLRPIFVVQVEDAGDGKVTRTDLAKALEVIQAEAGHLHDDEIAHSFQEAHVLSLGRRQIRYLAPPDIQNDVCVRVVFFKMSLNTGWDCPRAEVMLSFRRAVDDTSIAQLIGRMVRNPLARKVYRNEFLNTVALYLPFYDRRAADRVVKRLTTLGDEHIGADVDEGKGLLTLKRAPRSEEWFDRLSRLPRYEVHSRSGRTETRRLIALGRYLSQDGVSEGARDDAVALAVGRLKEELARVRDTPAFAAALESVREVTLRTLSFGVGDDIYEEGAERLIRHEANLNDEFATSGRVLGEGLHLAYVKARLEHTAQSVSEIKQELGALLQQPGVVQVVEGACRDLFTQWWQHHQSTILAMPEAQQTRYLDIKRTSRRPESMGIIPPTQVTWPTANTMWSKHLYVTDDGSFPCDVTGWEREVLTTVLSNPSTCAWLRNPVRKDWALSIPYRSADGTHKAMFPDFIIFRAEGSEIKVDIAEPHRDDEGDVPYKISGLADYADEHGHLFGRIEMLTKAEGRGFISIDVNNEETRRAARTVRTVSEVLQLFHHYGRQGQN